MAGFAFVLLVGAAWGYGYYGYEDKSSAERLAVNVEFGLDVAMLVGFLAVAALMNMRLMRSPQAVLSSSTPIERG